MNTQPFCTVNILQIIHMKKIRLCAVFVFCFRCTKITLPTQSKLRIAKAKEALYRPWNEMTMVVYSWGSNEMLILYLHKTVIKFTESWDKILDSPLDHPSTFLSIVDESWNTVVLDGGASKTACGESLFNTFQVSVMMKKTWRWCRGQSNIAATIPVVVNTTKIKINKDILPSNTPLPQTCNWNSKVILPQHLVNQLIA